MRFETTTMDDRLALVLPTDARWWWLSAGEGFAGCDPVSPVLVRYLAHHAFTTGEAAYELTAADDFLLVLPLTENQILSGALLILYPAWTANATAGATGIAPLGMKLMRLLEETNLLNGALLRERRRVQHMERLRGEAIHSAKSGDLPRLRELYWSLEPELFTAMRSGNRHEARRLLNQVLLAIYHCGEGSMDRKKGYILDLVTTMRRTMIDCGVDPGLVQPGYKELTRQLDAIVGDEELSHWVTRILETLIDAATSVTHDSTDYRLRLALNHMRENLDVRLSRDSVARKAGLSPGHFSHLMHRHTGRTFAANLKSLRMEKAARLLLQTKAGILEIALSCGFEDQSNFTRSFKRHHGCTPGEFRKLGRNHQRFAPDE